MAGPLAGLSAAQIAQQKLPEGAQQAGKAGPSKFDQSLKSPGSDPGSPGHAQQAQAIQQIDRTKQVEQPQKIEKTSLAKVDPNAKGVDPVMQKAEVNKATSLVMGLFNNLEKGGVNIDKIINTGISSKPMSNQELLQMQAGMYKYTQELDLCSKVVEKATSGLKDTLKTQV